MNCCTRTLLFNVRIYLFLVLHVQYIISMNYIFFVPFNTSFCIMPSWHEMRKDFPPLNCVFFCMPFLSSTHILIFFICLHIFYVLKWIFFEIMHRELSIQISCAEKFKNSWENDNRYSLVSFSNSLQIVFSRLTKMNM